MPFTRKNKGKDEKHSGAYREDHEHDEAVDGVGAINATTYDGARPFVPTGRRGSIGTGAALLVVDHSGQISWISPTFLKRTIRYIRVFDGYYVRKKASSKLTGDDSIRLDNIKIGIESLYTLHLLMIDDVNISNDHNLEYIRQTFQSIDLLDTYLSDRTRISCAFYQSPYSSGALARAVNDVALLRCDFSFLSESESSTRVARTPTAAADDGLSWRQKLVEEQAGRDRKQQRRMQESAAACAQRLAQAEGDAMRWRQSQSEEDENAATKKAEIDVQQEAKLARRLAFHDEQAATLKQLNEQYQHDEKNRRLNAARRQAEAVIKEAQRTKRTAGDNAEKAEKAEKAEEATGVDGLDDVDQADPIDQTSQADEAKNALSVYMPAPGRVDTPTGQSDDEAASDDSDLQGAAQGARAPAPSPPRVLAPNASPSSALSDRTSRGSQSDSLSGSDIDDAVMLDSLIERGAAAAASSSLDSRANIDSQSDDLSGSDDDASALLESLIDRGAAATVSAGFESRTSPNTMWPDTARTPRGSHPTEATKAAVFILRQRSNDDRDRPVTAEELASVGARSANDHAEIELARENLVSQANDILASERRAADRPDPYPQRVLPTLSGRRDPAGTFNELLSPPTRGVVIGESHSDDTVPAMLTDNMPSIARSGVRRLYLEGIGVESQSALDAGLARRGGLSLADNQRLEPVVNAALREGIRVHGVDSPVAHAVNPTTGAALRVPLLNAQASAMINDNATDGSPFLALTGAAHVNTYSNTPGIAERTNATGVVIVDDESAFRVGPGNQYDISDAAPPGQDPMIRPDYLFIAQADGDRGMALVPPPPVQPDAALPLSRSTEPVPGRRSRRSKLPQTDPGKKQGGQH